VRVPARVREAERVLLDARDRLADLVEIVFGTELPVRSHQPSLHAYYGDLRKPELLERFVRYHEDMLGFAGFDPSRKEVLDAGSGFGMVLVWLASRGARAHGLEIVSWRVEDVQTYLERLPAGVRDRVTVRQGSAAEMPHDDASFDLVLAIETVSHFLDYTRFLSEAHRVLRPGGTLLIVDGNNGLNPSIRRHCRHIWALHERDTVDEDNPWLFVPKRQRIIEEAFPELHTTRAHALALRTSGMVRKQILDAVRGYLETEAMPDKPYEHGQLTVHPEDEMVMERLLNPFGLARKLRTHGFQVKVRGYWGGASGRPLLRIANRALAALSPLTMFTARSFRIAAVKR
jgi:SAM-dependent methyltransferase